MVDPQSQATLSRSKTLRDLGLSHSHFQDAHQDAHENVFDILESCNVSDASSTRCSPCTRTSNITFDTFRANIGQSGSLDHSHGEIRELPSNLVSPPTSPQMAVAELECLLGNVEGKLKIGATVQPYHPDLFSHLETDGLTTTPKRPDTLTTLERAKVRPRVELDIQLAGDTFVQGQCISGHLVVHVRGHRSAENPVLLANNTLRIIGFEYLTDIPPFHVFFHFSRNFDDISYASEQIFLEGPDYCDEEGYREAKEGLHVLPFEMVVPMDPRFGKPKGVIDVPGGVAMRYIIMASIDMKDPDTSRLSLAHFYRQCSIWPGLSLQELLVPSTRPLVSTAVLSVPQGGSYSKLRLTARVPRPSYFAGQSCYVHIRIENNTQRTVRSLCMTLIRTTTIYRPRPGRRNDGEKTDEHKFMVKTVVDEISENRLVMAHRTTRRAASSRGWWMGVNPDGKTAFTHCVLVPHDALSVARSKLLAIDHAIRITVYASTGMLGLTTHLSVTLPVRIVSMLSVDPPTSVGSPCHVIGATRDHDDRSNGSRELRPHHSGQENRTDSPPPYRTRVPSLERPQAQNTTETLPRYTDTPLRQCAALLVNPAIGDESPGHEGKISFEVDSPPSRLITTHGHRLPAYAVGARSTGVAQEEQQFHNGVIRSPENKVTSLDYLTGGNSVFENSVNDGARESDAGQGNARRGHSVSPVPSLHRARERAVTAAHRSEFVCREQTQIERWQRKGRHPSCLTYGDPKDEAGSRDFRSYGSPFTQRVREKLRRVHECGEDAAKLHVSIEGPELNCEPETSTLTADCYRAAALSENDAYYSQRSQRAPVPVGGSKPFPCSHGNPRIYDRLGKVRGAAEERNY